MESNIAAGGRHFEDRDHAEAYAKYRRVFPAELVQRITKFIQDGGCQCDTAVDVGCGTGHQSTLPLSRFFNNVIGVDISQEQINQAPTDLPNITFRVGRAEDLSFLQDDSVDLVSVATAIHWLDLDIFYKEVNRVLRPRGCLAVYWHGRSSSSNHLITQELAKMRQATFDYRSEAIIKFFDRKERPECPYGEWIYHEDIIVERQRSVEEMVASQLTLSYNRAYLKEHPDTNLFRDYGRRLTELARDGGDSNTQETPVIDIRHPVHLLLCRKPNL